MKVVSPESVGLDSSVLGKVRSYLDNNFCNVEHSFEMVYNRMVLYEADVLHGQNAELGHFTNFDRINQVLFM